MSALSDPLDAHLLQQLLTTQTFGRTVHLLTQTASTNDVAKTLAQQGAPEGTVVLAEQQTQGRGRQGRSFASPKGVGIYLSLLLRPWGEASRFPQLTLLVAVAVADTLAEESALPIDLKWPNDVCIHGKKVAGVLTEGVFLPHVSPAVIIGIGINVNTTLEHLPPDLHAHVTSLALAAGHSWARPPLIALLLSHLERLYQTFQQVGIAPILSRWLHYSRIVGRRALFPQEHGMVAGVVLGLDDDGALVVQDAAGQRQRVVSGGVIFE
jgi:BirA family biotin operon repressor/biotin-[acetyl-CoA-carboxylase] ligase